jgi:hypothetical protein
MVEAVIWTGIGATFIEVWHSYCDLLRNRMLQQIVAQRPPIVREQLLH